MATRGRREFLLTLKQFAGANFDADAEDLGKFAPVQENLIVGAAMTDLRTALGLQKLNVKALAGATDDQVSAYVTENCSNFAGQLVCVHTHEDGYEKPRLAKQSMSDALTASESARFAENWGSGWGPVYMPWLVAGTRLHVVGHAGIRPRFLWRDIVKNTGLKGLECLWTATPGTGGSMAAGVYEYGVTLYDSVLARDGEMIRIVSATVAATGKVTIAGPVVSGHTFFTPRAHTDSGEPTDAHHDYYDFYRFWRRGPTQTDFYLVGEVAKATVEASDYSLVDSAANPGATVYIPNRRCFPSFRWCVFHQGRFVGLGLPAWTVAGTTVHCVNGAKPIYATTLPPYFRPWMDSRTIRIKDQNGVWVEHLIDYVWCDWTGGPGTVATNGTITLTGTATTFSSTFKAGDSILVSGETVRTIATIASDTSLTVTAAFSTTASGLSYTFRGTWKIALATAWAGTTGDYAWELMGCPNTVYCGNRVWGASEMFCLDGTLEIAVNEGDGQEIVAGLSMMHRLMVYKTGSIWAMTGGAWTDPEDSTPVQNDLDYYLVKDGVGIPGPYCVTPDADGAHWVFDGYSLLRNTGTDVVRVAEDKTRGFFSGLDGTRFHEAVIQFDTASNTVLLYGLYRPGRDVPSEALVYHVKTGAVCPLTDFYVSGGGAVAQKW